MSAEYKEDAKIIDYTPDAAALAGAVVIQGTDIISVVVADLAADELGAVYIKGIFEFACASDSALAVGDNAFWNASSGLITATDTDVYAGRVTKAAASSLVRVSINFMPEKAGS